MTKQISSTPKTWVLRIYDVQLFMEVSRNWRLQKQRYGLVGEVCDHCGKKLFPPRDVCPYCAQALVIQAIIELATNGQPSIPVVLLEST